jgi:hypothetical protein
MIRSTTVKGGMMKLHKYVVIVDGTVLRANMTEPMAKKLQELTQKYNPDAIVSVTSAKDLRRASRLIGV